MKRFGAEILAAYSQVLFSRVRAAGVLVAAATFTVPRVGASGLGALLVASGLARLLHLDAARTERGHYGYNALLVGLALGAFIAPGAPLASLLFLIGFGAVAVVLVHAALETSLGGLLQLPALTLPFVAVTWLLLLAAPHFDGVAIASSLSDGGGSALLPPRISLYLRSLGALFFVPSEAAGALVLASLLAWSRIATLLSVLGFVVAQAVLALVAPHAITPSLPLVLGYNGAATAIALGGVWFVPQGASFLLGAVAVLPSAAIALAAAALFAPHGLPVLMLPFNLTMLVVLQAMRQRTRDGAPKAVDFESGTPEANLNYYRTRLARFGVRSAVRFRLPFSGRWTVTQGHDGKHTHRDEWRHALDFEAVGADGKNHEGAGAVLKDYYSYRLPVLAAAAGTVVKVTNHVPDNPPGERNAHDPWGNLVVIQHGPALYSLVAHLACGSVDVAEGQYVVAGTRLGACGNSGQSFVPHIHFHVQTGPRPGAPTCEFELSEVVTDDGSHAVLHRIHVPREGEVVRAIAPRDEIAALFRIPLGTRRTFEVADWGAVLTREIVSADIDLYNNTFLASESGGRLYFERQQHEFIVYDHIGAPGSMLHWIYAALPRVPFEAAEQLDWDDVLPSRTFRSGRTSWLIDFVDPFLRGGGQRLEFRSYRDGAAFVVAGHGRRGSKKIETTARFMPGIGLREVEVRLGDTVRRARLVEDESAVAREAAA